MLCFACGWLGHRKGNCPALIRSIDSANMNTPSSEAPKNPCSAEPLQGDHLDIPLKDSNSTTPERVTEPEALVYGEWMVVDDAGKSTVSHTVHT